MVDDVFAQFIFIGEYLKSGISLSSILRMVTMERLLLFGLLVPFVSAVQIKTGWVDYYQDYYSQAEDYRVVCYYDSFAHYRDGKQNYNLFSLTI